MGKPNFSDELKCDAVTQITEQGYPVAEVLQRPGFGTMTRHRGCTVQRRKRKCIWCELTESG